MFYSFFRVFRVFRGESLSGLLLRILRETGRQGCKTSEVVPDSRQRWISTVLRHEMALQAGLPVIVIQQTGYQLAYVAERRVAVKYIPLKNNSSE